MDLPFLSDPDRNAALGVASNKRGLQVKRSTSEKSTPVPKRKRGRKARGAVTEAGETEKLALTDEEIRALYRRVVHEGVPRIFADISRRAGHPSISFRDYECGCDPSGVDFLPVCQERKANCRFAGRLSAEEIAATKTPEAQAALCARMEISADCYGKGL